MALKYREVQDLVFRGFLTTKVQIGDETLVIKSLNHHELAQVSLRCPVRSHPDYEKLFEHYLVVYALFLVGGENVLPLRQTNISELLAEVSEIPDNIRHDILREVLYLQKAQDVTIKQLEAYSFEPESRHQWPSYRGSRINDVALTGVEGTDRLGINTHQIAWVYLNEEEDDRLKAEDQWGFAKFIASATNPKGVKKIDDRDKARLKRLDEDRDRIKKGEQYQGKVRVEARSVDELRKQLIADIDGKKDLHDRIMEEYETSIAKRRQERRDRMERELETRRQQREDEYVNLTDEELASSSGYVTVLTPDQLQKYKENKAKERFELVEKLQQARIKQAEASKEDKRTAHENITRLVEKEDPSMFSKGPPKSLTLPTDEHGPVGSDRSPPPRMPEAEVTYVTNPNPKPANAVEQGRTVEGSASQRLVRQYPSPAYAKPPTGKPNKTGHMTHTNTIDEDDFFGGGSTTFSNDPKKPGKR